MGLTVDVNGLLSLSMWCLLGKRRWVTASKRLLPKVGDVGKRVRSAHNAEGVSDPQSSTEASTDHG